MFRERNADNFTFNAPFTRVTPPYAYTLDSVSTVPTIVTRYAGVGRLGFVFWQLENFTSTELADPAVSGPEAVLTGDGAKNLQLARVCEFTARFAQDASGARAGN